MKHVLCYPNSKHPIGPDWGSKAITADEVAQRLAGNPALNIGLLLGPVSGVIDVECDGPEATDNYNQLFSGIRAPGWKAKLGEHHLFKYDTRVAELPAVVKLLGIEFRLGNGKQAQSICPPSIVDGVRREWMVKPEDCEPPALPDAVVDMLLKAPKAKPKREHADIPAARQATVKRLLRYCQRVGLKVQGIHGEGPVYINLASCPFKHPENEKGAPAFIVNPDGKFAFHCFHAGCADKRLADVEDLLGPVSPTIRLGNDLSSIVEQAIQALTEHPNTFQRVGFLVEVSRDAPKPKLCLAETGGPQFRLISQATARANLSSVARWEKFNERKNKYVFCLPSDAVVSAVLSSAQYPDIPVATGMVHSPVLRADGAIAKKAGYDAETGLYLDIEGDYPALMKPADAVVMLTDVVSDFPFATDAHRSGWFAALLTQLARPAFAGAAPFFLFDGNTSRVGKGLLTDLIAMIVEGRRAARQDFSKSEDEIRKLITSVAISGTPYVLFDNIKGKFGGKTIENAITSGRWSDRLLGGNHNVDVAMNVVWLGTSNNATLTKDMIGRTCHSRLETDWERPDLRSDFTYPDLLGYAKDKRRELVMAALSIPAAYIAAGRPEQNLSSWGGFEGWSDLIRASIVWAGLPDPDTRDNLANQADDETDELRQLLDGWAQIGPVKCCEAIERIEDEKAPILRALLPQSPGERNKALPILLRQYRGRVLDGRKLVNDGKKVPCWRVEQVQA